MGTEIEVIEHTVVVQDATVSAFGFGVPLIAVAHTYWPELVRTFETATELTLAPFNVPTSSALYQHAARMKQQQPSPPQFKVGKLTGTYSHEFELLVAEPTAVGTVYTVTINGTAVSVTSTTGQTGTNIATALVTAIGAITGVNAAALVAPAVGVGVTAEVANTTLVVTGLSPTLTLNDTTPAPAELVDDLTAIREYDGDWYALTLLTPGQDAIIAAAGWVEGERAIYMASSQDAPITDIGVDDDVASLLQSQTIHRTAVWYHPMQEFIDAAAVGVMLPKLPGPVTFANKGLTGVTMQSYNATIRNALNTKNADYYLNIKGLGFTLHGAAASGRFLDVTVAIDWFDVGIEDRIITLLRNNDVVPYTVKGIELVRAQIQAQISQGIDIGIIDGAQPFSATAPALESIDPNLKRQRILPDMRYSYVLAGSIHKVRINGTVQV